MKKIIPIAIIAIILSGVGGFYGGLKYGQSKNSLGNVNFSPDQMARFQQSGGTNRRVTGATGQGQNGGMTAGEILSKDDSSLTVKLRDGGSKIVFYSPKTVVSRMATGTADELVAGENVIVNGSANADGSVVAQSIQISNGAWLGAGQAAGREQPTTVK